MGGGAWESRRPLIHRWAPGQGPDMCELLWEVLPTWPPQRDGHVMSEQIWQPNCRHLPADAGRVAGSPGAQCACLASEAVSIFGDGVCRGRADGANMCRCVESRVLGAGITHLASRSPTALGQHRSPLPRHRAIPHPLPPAALPPGRWGFRHWNLSKWRCLASWDAAGMDLG